MKFRLELQYDDGKGFLSIQDAPFSFQGKTFTSPFESYLQASPEHYWDKIRKPNELRFSNGSHVTLGQEHGISWTQAVSIDELRGSFPNPRRTINNVSSEPGGLNVMTQWDLGELQSQRSTMTNHAQRMSDHMHHVSQHVTLQDRFNRQAQEEALARSIRATQDERDRREAQRIAERDRLEAERNRPSFLRRINPFR